MMKLKQFMFALVAMMLGFAMPISAQVAKVGNTEYATIDEAIANWTNGTTLTLLADVTLSDVVTLKSTEHHILDLDTYTMTAASGKNAIVIKAYGTGDSERYAITIKADANTPGKIDAGSKSIIYYNYNDGPTTSNDRPIINVEGGEFVGSTSQVHILGSGGGIYFNGKKDEARKAATLQISGGIFNCSILGQTKSKLIITGGVFNYSVGSQGDQTAYRLISGGKFKTLGFMTADNKNTKFWFGTAMAKSDVGIYVDDEGYLCVGGPVITELGPKYKAVASNATKWSSYLTYSSAATNGLYYTNAEAAIKKHGAANVTVWEKPAVTIPENVTGDTNVVEEIKNNTALNDYTPVNLPEGAELEIELKSVGETIVYDVTPMANGVEVEPTQVITFRLPVPASVTNAYAKVYHEDTLMGLYAIQGEGNAKYVEISSADFSVYTVEPTTPVAKIDETAYATLADAVAAAQNNATITLIGNVVLAEVVTIPADKTLTIDLNGKSISMQESIIATAYAINNLGNLTIKDGVGGGSVNARGMYNGYGNGGENVASATMTILGGTFNAKGTNGGAAIFNYGTANVDGGKFTSVGSYSLSNQSGSTMTVAEGVTVTNGIYNSSDVSLTVNGGNISNSRSGCHTIYAWNAKVTVNGGSIHNENSGNATIMSAGTSEVTINGGTISIKDGRVPGNGNTWTSCLTDAANTAKIIVNGGTFNGGFRVQAGSSMTINGGSFNDVYGSNYNIYGTVTVTGGTFTDATAKAFATKYVAEGYELNEGTVEKIVVAKIGDVEYATLSAAFAAVTDDNQTVVICKDVTENLTATLRGNITTENDDAKVTITLTNSDWVYCPYTFVLGENVTMNVPALFYYAGGAQINGTLVVDAYYQRYAGTKLTINEPGSMTVTGETCIIRYMDGDANAGIYVVGDNNDETIGLNLAVAYFYQGMINAKDANIVAGTYWQTNDTDGQGSANLILDNSTLTVTVYDHPAKATGNSTVTLTNGSVIDAKNGGFTYGDNTTLSVDATSKIIGKGGEEVKIPVASVDDVKYYTLEDAFKAATSGCTIEILSDVTVDYNWDARNTGAKFIVPVTINGNGNTIKFTASVNDNNYQAPFRFEADATVKNLTIDMSETTDSRFRAISSKGNLTVGGCEFIGKDATLNCRAIIFGEGAGANVGNLAISVTNSEFINWKRGITDNENGQDVQSATITGNTLTNAAVYVSAYENVTFTGNTVEGAYVDIRSYSANNSLNVTATGNTLEENTATDYNYIKNAGGTVNQEGFVLPPVVMIGEKGYQSVKEALEAAKAENLTDVVIKIVGENTVATADEFDLIYTTVFDNVTFKQENGNKPYYFVGLYTGSRTNNGTFVFDGVNISVTSNGQYFLEGNVVLSNNSYIKSSAEANCFVYNAEVTIEAGSKIDGVIEDIRGGSLIIDGGKTDGTYCDEPALRDAILSVNWASSNLVLKNGAYVKVNSANEVGRLTVNGQMDVSNSKLESYQWIAVNQGATLALNAGSIITTQKLTGAGTINIDATGITEEVAVIKANLSGFTGTINVEGGSYEITSEGLVVKMPVLSGEGTEANPYLISSVDELVLFRNSVNAGKTTYNADGKYVALGANIDLAGIDWSVNIGDDCNATFDGIFDGKNFTISNLTATETAQKGDGYICTGLFGAIYGNAVVKNLTLENVTIDAPYAGNNVAAVVGFGYNAKGSIENVHVTGDIDINAPNATGVGAILGYDYACTALKVENCEVKGNDGSDIVGKSYVGGLVGYAYSKIALKENTVENVSVTGTGSVGAIAGIMLAGGSADRNTVKNVALSATGELWANSVAVVAGTITKGSVTAANTTVENVTANGADAPIVGGVLVEKPTTPIEKVQAKIGNVYFATIDAAMASNVDGVVDIFTDVTLNDADANGYTFTKEAKVNGKLTYTREFSQYGSWNALYLPFEVPVADLLENYDIAYLNDVHSFDDNEDGEIDRYVMEHIKVKKGTLRANFPYLIYPKDEDAKNLTITIEDGATLCKAEENTVECSSVFTRYSVKGIYQPITGSDFAGKYALTPDGAWMMAGEEHTLGAYRLVMTITDQNGEPVIIDQTKQSIRIAIRGEGDLTDLEEVELNTNGETLIFDLQGRRVTTPTKGGVYIVNGKKIYFNK